MLLADLGAHVIGVLRPGVDPPAMTHNRALVRLDLRDGSALAAVRELVSDADILIEGFRPGVMERLTLGPEHLVPHNERLIYARMTGWGQTGPRAHTAGHDLTYIAVTGALHLGTRAGGLPTPTANLLGDFAGGGFYLVTAILAALHERHRTGRGRVLDIGIVDGVTYLTAMLHEYRATGRWTDAPGANRLDTGAPYYDVYECADGRHLAIGALEEPFFQAMLRVLGIDPDLGFDRLDPENWPRLRSMMSEAVKRRTRDEWASLAADSDACMAPVLDLGEASGEAHVRARAVLAPRPDGVGFRPVLPIGHSAAGATVAETLRCWTSLSEGGRALLHGSVVDTVPAGGDPPGP
jgi:alpha-methylacyl-CoA racemase